MNYFKMQQVFDCMFIVSMTTFYARIVRMMTVSDCKDEALADKSKPRLEISLCIIYL